MNIFNSEFSRLIDKVRFENFNTLEIEFENKIILELGSGIGNHTDFILSKNPKKVVTIEGRLENYTILEKKYNDSELVETIHHDLEKPILNLKYKFDWIYHYGLLYHLSNPFQSLDFLIDLPHDNMIIETCVELNGINNNLQEDNNPTQALNGIGSRPNLKLLEEKLSEIYYQITIPNQPIHEWWDFNSNSELKRIVIICRNKK